MLKIGIIGLNPGNGHPISYSSIFNGYNEHYLKKYCKFELIKAYLPLEHKNKKSNIISGAKVVTIWTQSELLSKKIAKICNIKHVSKSLNEMSKIVDAVILARDDYQNHMKMAKIFLRKKIPIFIDKLICDDLNEFKFFEKNSKKLLFMSASSAGFTREIEKLEKNRKQIKKDTIFITGFSRVNWGRYAHHLLEGILKIYGLDIKKVRCVSWQKDKEVYELVYKNGINVFLFFQTKLSLPIELNCYSKNQKRLNIPYTDYFYSIKKMMNTFYSMIKNNKQLIEKKRMLFMSRLVIAGILSKNDNLNFYCPKKLTKTK